MTINLPDGVFARWIGKKRARRAVIFVNDLVSDPFWICLDPDYWESFLGLPAGLEADITATTDHTTLMSLAFGWKAALYSQSAGMLRFSPHFPLRDKWMWMKVFVG